MLCRLENRSRHGRDLAAALAIGYILAMCKICPTPRYDQPHAFGSVLPGYVGIIRDSGHIDRVITVMVGDGESTVDMGSTGEFGPRVCHNRGLSHKIICSKLVFHAMFNVYTLLHISPSRWTLGLNQCLLKPLFQIPHGNHDTQDEVQEEIQYGTPPEACDPEEYT